MSLYKNNEERKLYALNHWAENIDKLKKLDWELWQSLTMSARANTSQCGSPGIPNVYGDACPYCREFNTSRGRCSGCPLREKKVECCRAWINVLDAFIIFDDDKTGYKPKQRKKICEKAFREMYKYIKEKG